MKITLWNQQGSDRHLLITDNGQTIELTTDTLTMLRDDINMHLGGTPAGARPLANRLAEITILYRAGYTVPQIGQQVGLKACTVSTYISKLGIANRKPANKTNFLKSVK